MRKIATKKPAVTSSTRKFSTIVDLFAGIVKFANRMKLNTCRVADLPQYIRRGSGTADISNMLG